jgi:hypothetical protein
MTASLALLSLQDPLPNTATAARTANRARRLDPFGTFPPFASGAVELVVRRKVKFLCPF